MRSKKRFQFNPEKFEDFTFCLRGGLKPVYGIFE